MLAKAPNDSASVLADAIRSACIMAALLATLQLALRGSGRLSTSRTRPSSCSGVNGF